MRPQATASTPPTPNHSRSRHRALPEKVGATLFLVIVSVLALYVSSSLADEATVTTGTASPITTLSTDTSPCTRGQTHAAFNSFFASFNRGDFAKLDSLFAEKPDFKWYSSPHPGRRLGAEAKKRDTLIPYFRRRHAKDEEFRLLAFNFSGNTRHWSNFWFEAIRRADGFNDGKWRGMPGKGAAVCGQGSPQIIVLSVGGPAPGG